jgi:hypothetical protein
MLIFYGGSDDEGTMNDIHLLDLKALRHLESAYRRIRYLLDRNILLTRHDKAFFWTAARRPFSRGA